MADIDAGKGRAIVERDGEALRITFPAPAQVGALIFLCVWLTGWAFGEFYAAQTLLSGEAFQDSAKDGPLLLIVWFSAWTLAGGWFIYILLWQLFGKEIIELTSTSLKQFKQVLLFSRNREYALASITNVRLAPPEPKYHHGKYVIASQSFASGAIAFGYGRTTYRLGQGLDEAEARYVMGELHKRLKPHDPEDEAG